MAVSGASDDAGWIANGCSWGLGETEGSGEKEWNPMGAGGYGRSRWERN